MLAKLALLLGMSDLSPKIGPKENKYKAHQGAKEKARRLKQMANNKTIS